jgi:molybdopterin/thiamine biosynthesis adenylyltransferase
LPDEGFLIPAKDLSGSPPQGRTRLNVLAKKKQILIIGVGGLGVPAAYSLARARGDGLALNLTLLDPDVVEVSNLPRQVIFGESDLGFPKVIAAAERLSAIFPGTEIEPIQASLDHSNAREIIARSDFVIDATDNPITKFLINDVCVECRVPFVYGGVLGLSGQAMTVLPRATACLRCLFEEPPDETEVASCREAGIIGPVAGAIGAVQAAEALSFVNDRMPALAGKMLTLDGSHIGRIRLTPIAARVGCRCGAAQANAAAGRIASPAI